jgi:hypothetical protein
MRAERRTAHQGAYGMGEDAYEPKNPLRDCLHPVPQLGVMAEFGYNQLGLSDIILNAAGVPGGTGRIYSVTLKPIRYHYIYTAPIRTTVLPVTFGFRW